MCRIHMYVNGMAVCAHLENLLPGKYKPYRPVCHFRKLGCHDAKGIRIHFAAESAAKKRFYYADLLHRHTHGMGIPVLIHKAKLCRHPDGVYTVFIACHSCVRLYGCMNHAVSCIISAVGK